METIGQSKPAGGSVATLGHKGLAVTAAVAIAIAGGVLAATVGLGLASHPGVAPAVVVDSSYDQVEAIRVQRGVDPGSFDRSYDSIERLRGQTTSAASLDGSYDAIERLRAER